MKFYLLCSPTPVHHLQLLLAFHILFQSKSPSIQENPKQKMRLPIENEEIHLTISDLAISYSLQFSNTHFHVAAEKRNVISITFVQYFIEIQNDIAPAARSKLTCPAPPMATTCEKSIPDILILSNKMSRALIHINVGDVIRPFFEFDPLTPPFVRYSGNSTSYCTHSLASNCKFPLMTTALS